jgi:hypothetical protein
MPVSFEHEFLVDLFRKRAELAVQLLRTCANIEVDYAHVAHDSIDLSQVVPTGYFAARWSSATARGAIDDGPPAARDRRGRDRSGRTAACRPAISGISDQIAMTELITALGRARSKSAARAALDKAIAKAG